MESKQIEEGLEFVPKFDANGLIPAIAQDAATGDVLMVAYMNREALPFACRTPNQLHASTYVFKRG